MPKLSGDARSIKLLIELLKSLLNLTDKEKEELEQALSSDSGADLGKFEKYLSELGINLDTLNLSNLSPKDMLGLLAEARNVIGYDLNKEFRSDSQESQEIGFLTFKDGGKVTLSTVGPGMNELKITSEGQLSNQSADFVARCADASQKLSGKEIKFRIEEDSRSPNKPKVENQNTETLKKSFEKRKLNVETQTSFRTPTPRPISTEV